MELYNTWNEFDTVYKMDQKDANIFYSKQYEDFEKNRGNSCIYIGNKIAVIVVSVWRKGVFKWGEMPSEPFYLCEQDRTVDVEQRFLDLVIDKIMPEKISWLAASGTTANFCAFPTKSKRIPFGNYIIDLTQDEETLFAGVTSKCRNMIRRAEKDDVKIIHGGIELLDDYILADRETWNRSGLKKEYRLDYERYLKFFGSNAEIFIAKKNHLVQGGAIFLYNEAMSYYLYGASINKPSPGALNLLQYRAMLEMKRRGVQYYNFVGCRIDEDKDSKYHGIQKFKSSFGGKLFRGYMFKSTDHSQQYKTFITLYRIKNGFKKMNGDIIDQEIHKWKDINL